MKKVNFFGFLILILLLNTQFDAEAQKRIILNADSTEAQVDSVRVVTDSTNTKEAKINDDEDYEISDLLNIIVDPLLKKYTHRRANRHLATIYSRKPFISLYVGPMDLENKSIKYDFDRSADIQLLLGYSNRKQYRNTSLIRTDNTFLSIKNISNNWINLKDNDNPISSKTWSIGYNQSKDYGWNFDKNFKINLTHNEGIIWSFMNFNTKSLDPLDTINYPAKLIPLNNKMKFGENFSAGMEIELFNHVSLLGGYERMDVFPAHIFWQWVVGDIIEDISQSMVDSFVKRVRGYSPWATPIVNFVLKNGLSYGLYELRRSKMNWPFNSASPYVFETFKVGMSYKF
ncbi:MAG: hypothetical protein ABFD61_08770 [Chloroherpetonaceae bacterium]